MRVWCAQQQSVLNLTVCFLPITKASLRIWALQLGKKLLKRKCSHFRQTRCIMSVKRMTFKCGWCGLKNKIAKDSSHFWRFKMSALYFCCVGAVRSVTTLEHLFPHIYFISSFSIPAPAWGQKLSSLPCELLPFYFPFDKLLRDKTEENFQGMSDMKSNNNNNNSELWMNCYSGLLMLLPSNEIIFNNANRVSYDWRLPDSAVFNVWFFQTVPLYINGDQQRYSKKQIYSRSVI